MLRSVGGWIAVGLAVVIAFGALSIRGQLTADQPPPSSTASATAAASHGDPDGEVTAAAPLARELRTPSPPKPTPIQTPEPTPEPAPIPTPPPPPPAPTPEPVAAAPTPPDDGAAGGLAPRTAPPGWTPPVSQPGDIWTTGSFGQTLSSGAISVSAARLPLDTDSSACNDGNPIPSGYVRVGFRVTTTWSGYPIPVYSADAPSQGPTTCWLGDPAPLVSGVTYDVFLLLPPAQAATTLVRMGYFPNGASPAYIFEFR